MADDAQDLIAAIVAELHELFRALDPHTHATGVARVEELVARLKGAGQRSTIAGSHRSAYRLPGIVTTDDSPSLRHQLNTELRTARAVRIATAFLSGSDTNPLVQPLKELTDRGVQVRLLTSVMGFINRPDVLGAFLDWGPNLALHLYHENPDHPETLLAGRARGFHAKTILIEKDRPPHPVAIGSANLTGAGLETNVEWNYLTDFEVTVGLGDAASPYERAVALFDSVWAEKSFCPDAVFLERYRELHRRGRSLRRQLSELSADDDPGQPDSIQPNAAQADALARMAQLRADGVNRYSVIAATGIGKTILSAFDARNAHASRLLFLAHRRSILEQAMSDFAMVHANRVTQLLLQGEESVGRLPAGGVHVFAMVQTIGRPGSLERIPASFFEYLVVDEFHHAAADTYRRVLSHFRPNYLLRMTATPERTDGQDVLEVWDRHVAYEVRLHEAIDRGWLVPFQYYALHDPSDYRQVRWTGMGYDEAELERLLSTDTRADLIVRNLRRYQGSPETRKVLAFCSNVGHAKWMARALTHRGVIAEALVGESSEAQRSDLIRRLEDDEDELEVLCTVDVLSEGVDIPAISHILLIRPTQSFTVFLQQIGRGLRLHPGKGYVVALDFVGNYQRSFVAPLALNGCRTVPKSIEQADDPAQFKPPAGCYIDANAEVRRIWLRELASLDPRHRRLLRIEVALQEIADGDRSTAEVRLPELFTYSTEKDSSSSWLAGIIRRLGGWLRVRTDLGITGELARGLLGTAGESFLNHMEDDPDPVKSYKMAVLHALLDQADSQVVRTAWAVEDIAPAFLSYCLVNRRRMRDYIDLARADDPNRFPIAKVVRKLKDMPLKMLSNAPSKPFALDGDHFVLRERYRPFWQDRAFRALVRERVEYAEARYRYTH